MRLLDKLLEYLPKAVYNLSPDPILVMRIRATNSLSWQVTESRTLIITANDVESTYTLNNKTMLDLASEIQLNGVTVEYLNSDQLGRQAASLMAGTGDQDESNGDHLMAHQNILWSLFGAYADELKGAKIQSGEALKQMVIPDAENEWLDIWGELYGITRRADESDSVYALRLPKEAFRLRVNPRAIELAIQELTGKDVRVVEPWKNIARWDEAILDDDDRFYDGDFIGYHLIQLVSNESVDWSEIVPIAHRNRPTGVLMLPPATRLSFWVDATGHAVTPFAIHQLRGSFTQYEDKLLWDYACFGDTPIPNRDAYHTRDITRYSHSTYDDSTYDYLLVPLRDHRFYDMESVIYLRQTWNSSATWGNAAWGELDDVEPAIHTRS